MYQVRAEVPIRRSARLPEQDPLLFEWLTSASLTPWTRAGRRGGIGCARRREIELREVIRKWAQGCRRKAGTPGYSLARQRCPLPRPNALRIRYQDGSGKTQESCPHAAVL